MPINNIIGYNAKNSLLDNAPNLRLLSEEINQLESLQKETLKKYQRMKYNLPEDTKQNFFR